LASCKLRGSARGGRERLVQGEISPTPEAIIKEIAFNGRTNYARTKDVTEFNAAKETDVIFGSLEILENCDPDHREKIGNEPRTMDISPASMAP
jgi:hypothetical protein